MKITVTKKTLNDALTLLERIIPSRSSNPLLTSVKIEASDGHLILTGSNLDMEATLEVPAEFDELPRVMALPAHLLAQIVRNAPGNLIEMELQGYQMHVRSAGSSAALQVQEDYPAQIGQVRAVQQTLTVHAPDLKRALNAVTYAASNEAFQAVFRGILFRLKRTGGLLVASDGYRVATHQLDTEVSFDQPERDVVIPARSIEQLIRLLGHQDREVELDLNEDGSITVRGPRMRVTLAHLEGNFPDFERVIPRDIQLTVTVNAATLCEAAGRVGILADKNANNRIELLFSDNKLQLLAQGDYGRAQDLLDVHMQGQVQALRIALNGSMFLQCLSVASGEVTLEFSGSTSPVNILDEGRKYHAVIVALRI